MSEYLSLTYLGKDDALGHNTQDEGVLTVCKLTTVLWTLPVVVVLHQVYVVKRRVVELCVIEQRWAVAVVGSI